jgi:hypothetical protein
MDRWLDSKVFEFLYCITIITLAEVIQSARRLILANIKKLAAMMPPVAVYLLVDNRIIYLRIARRSTITVKPIEGYDADEQFPQRLQAVRLSSHTSF